MRMEYELLDTKGIRITYDGRVYTTVENIHYECDPDDEQLPITLLAQCATNDPAIMWGEGDETSDWFPPEAHWSVYPDDLDAWADAQDWQANLDGVLTCDAPDN